MKDENIELISKLEESMGKAMQLEQKVQHQEADYKQKIKTIETELQKYMLTKQQENQKLLL